MPITLNPGQSVPFTLSAVTAAGHPSTAVISNLAVTASDATAVSIALSGLGGTLTALTPATLPDALVVTATATATETDGRVKQITGTDTVTIQAIVVPPPPPPAAASLVFAWGTPSTPVPPAAKGN
jgi:hypothetical protein